MIEVRVNDEIRKVDGERPLAALLEQWGYRSEKVAVAVNEDFVPRSQYGDYRLKARDRVEIVAPVQGG